jgi:hypothetical protein
MLNKSYRLYSNIKKKKEVKSTEKNLVISLNPTIESLDSFKLKNTTTKGKPFSFISQKTIKSTKPTIKNNKNYNKRVSS